MSTCYNQIMFIAILYKACYDTPLPILYRKIVLLAGQYSGNSLIQPSREPENKAYLKIVSSNSWGKKKKKRVPRNILCRIVLTRFHCKLFTVHLCTWFTKVLCKNDLGETELQEERLRMTYIL